MPRRLLAIVALLFLSTSWLPARSARGDQADGETLVPSGHWGYEALQNLAELGFPTGFPDGFFAGRRPVARRDMALATANTLARARYLSEAGLPWPMIDRKPARFPFAAMFAAFGGELPGSGITPRQYLAEVAAVEAYCRSERPRGVTAPLAEGEVWPDPGAYAEGVRAAEAGWKRGEFALWFIEGGHGGPSTPRERPVPSGSAIPILPAPGNKADPAASGRVLGHNARMWSFLRTPYGPERAGRPWLREVFQLSRAWRHAATRRWLLQPAEASFRSPDGCRRLSFQPPPNWLCCLAQPDVEEGETRAPYLRDPKRLQVRGGPEESGILFIRGPAAGDAALPWRLYAIDLQTGGVLNAQAAPDADFTR